MRRDLLLWQLRWLFYHRMIDRLFWVSMDPEWNKSERAWAAYKGVDCAVEALP